MRLYTGKSIFSLATFGLLGMIAALVWLSGAEVVNAQSVPFIVEGKVLIDGRPAPDGTKIIAFVDGQDVGETRTKAGAFIMALPEQPGQSFAGRPVEFAGKTVEGKLFDFPQKAIWHSGGRANIALQTLTGAKILDNVRPAPVVAERHPPWVVQGKVIIDGRPAPDRTRISAFIHVPRAPRETLAGARTSGNAFVLTIPEPPRRSLSGVSITFEARLDDGRSFLFPQTFIWLPGETSSITLAFPGGQQFAPTPEPRFPIPQIPDGMNIECVIKVLGRIPAGPQDMSPLESLRVARECFSGGGSPDDSARIELERLQMEQEKQRLEQELKFQQEQQRLEADRLRQERTFQLEQQRLDTEQRNREQERIKREQALQEQQDRLDRDRLKSERERQQEQARLDAERRKQDLDRFIAEQEMQQEQQLLDQRRAMQEQQRQDELEKARFESERASINRERILEEERARLDQERLIRDDERRRLEEEINLRNRQAQGPRGETPEIRDSSQTPEGDLVQSGPTRGFFTNTRVGGLGAANQLIDPTMLAVIGILITMAATLMQMVKGS